ncbi:hypothetical protein [Corynebacterium lubricantis]|uniref:hypothetical protein n=1 Tax=Corynebacterium lubricantis TaxID=541095 RepID=UPI000364EC2A|nr:hypothetical protein [Corynebacterium lubricantis]
MHHAVSQVSRTQIRFATPTRDELSHTATTWAFSCKKTSTTQENTAKNLADASAKLAYREVIYEDIASRIATEKGQTTLLRRVFGVDSSGKADEDVAAEMLDVLGRVDDARAHVVATVGPTLPEVPNARSVSLPVTVSVAERAQSRWQSRTLWVRGALATLQTCGHKKLERVGKQHWSFIVRAAASFADDVTGHSCTAANRTIGRRAQQLAHDAEKKGYRTKGRRTAALSEKSMTRAVSHVMAALADLGWVIVRATGRHLTTAERVVAFARHRTHQIKAGSVRDLVTPRESFVVEKPREAKPAWAVSSNPFMRHGPQATVGEGTWKALINQAKDTIVDMCSNGLLSPHRCVAPLSSLLTLSKWLLNAHTRASKPSSNEKKQRKPGFRRDPASLQAQKTAASLADRLPWLIRKPTGGRYHLGALAHVIEDTGSSHLAASEIQAGIDAFLAARGWEIYPTDIRRPLAWLRTVLTRHNQANAIFVESMAKHAAARDESRRSRSKGDYATQPKLT